MTAPEDKLDRMVAAALVATQRDVPWNVSLSGFAGEMMMNVAAVAVVESVDPALDLALVQRAMHVISALTPWTFVIDKAEYGLWALNAYTAESVATRRLFAEDLPDAFVGWRDDGNRRMVAMASRGAS